MSKLILTVEDASWGSVAKKCIANFYDDKVELLFKKKSISYEYKNIHDISIYGTSIITFKYNESPNSLMISIPRYIIDDCIDIMKQNKEVVSQIYEQSQKSENETTKDTPNNDIIDKKEIPNNTKEKQQSNSNGAVGGVIVFIVICIAIFWGISKSGFFRTFNRSAIGTWYNEAGTVLKIKEDGVCEVELSETDNFVLQFKQYYDWGDVKITKCEWKKDFNDETKVSVLVYAEYGTLAFHDYLISNQFVHSDDWGGFKRK